MYISCLTNSHISSLFMLSIFFIYSFYLFIFIYSSFLFNSSIHFLYSFHFFTSLIHFIYFIYSFHALLFLMISGHAEKFDLGDPRYASSLGLCRLEKRPTQAAVSELKEGKELKKKGLTDGHEPVLALIHSNWPDRCLITLLIFPFFLQGLFLYH